jgi:hypothetical protein
VKIPDCVELEVKIVLLKVKLVPLGIPEGEYAIVSDLGV